MSLISHKTIDHAKEKLSIPQNFTPGRTAFRQPKTTGADIP
jgi:hypothetical protein